MSYITITDRDDGFGAQMTHILYGMMYAEQHNAIYLHKPFSKIDHNYDNDIFFIDKIEEFLNIKNNFKTTQEISKYEVIPFWPLYDFIVENFDKCLEGNAIKNYKSILWNNKTKPLYFMKDKLNIVIHIRRFNQCDWDSNRIDSDSYFLNIIDKLRKKYTEPKIIHIYSQGSKENFINYNEEDIILHLNEDLRDTFLGMVSADVLVTSKSALSFSAAILTDGIVYYDYVNDRAPSYNKWFKTTSI